MHSVGDAENPSNNTLCHSLRTLVLALTKQLNLYRSLALCLA